MPIRQLSPETINRIAAGEVVERPASVVKELVENALDAGATEIEVVTASGGLALIRVTDDGVGMPPDDLVLAVDRHATSKLSEEDLFDIRTLGFRGEALPSIGSIALLTIQSRRRGAADTFALSVDRGAKGAVKPAAGNNGTCVEVRDLFSSVPARLKFLKSERAENQATSEVIKRLAMAHPQVGLTLTTGERTGLRYPREAEGDAGLLQRLGRIMGRDFMDDAVPVAATRDKLAVRGFAGLPTLHRPDAAQQFLFVNGRPVKDKLLIGAVRAAYGDLIPRGRHPLLALFLTLPPDEVDVNVHPAKVEVRFRDAGQVRSLIVNALGAALYAAGHRAAAANGSATLQELRANVVPFERTRPGYYPAVSVSGSPRPCRRRSMSWIRRAPIRVPSWGPSPRSCSIARWGRRVRSCTRTTSWRRRGTASSSSISTRRTSAWSTSVSRRCWRPVASRGRACWCRSSSTSTIARSAP
jgi:DNA mismatch repair protein MutL